MSLLANAAVVPTPNIVLIIIWALIMVVITRHAYYFDRGRTLWPGNDIIAILGAISFLIVLAIVALSK